MVWNVVKIKSRSSDADPKLGLPLHIIAAQIISYNKNEEVIYIDVTIDWFDNLPKVFFSKPQAELVCLLELKQESYNKYRCDGLDWYFKNKKFFWFKNDKEISQEIIFKSLKWPRTVFDTVFDNLDHAKIPDHIKILNAQNFYEPRVVPGADLV